MKSYPKPQDSLRATVFIFNLINNFYITHQKVGIRFSYTTILKVFKMIHIINLVEGYMPGVWWGASRVKGNVAKISRWVDRWAWEEEVILICKIDNKSPRKKKVKMKKQWSKYKEWDSLLSRLAGIQGFCCTEKEKEKKKGILILILTVPQIY